MDRQQRLVAKSGICQQGALAATCQYDEIGLLHGVLPYRVVLVRLQGFRRALLTKKPLQSELQGLLEFCDTIKSRHGLMQA